MSHPPLVIYCDFDGTVTQGDVVDILLTELADPSWRAVEAEWEQGRIGSRECLARQIPLIRGGWPAIEQQLRHIDLDPTFPAFAAWCRAENVPLWVVSDGLDRVISTLLARAHITVDGVWANHLDESPAGTLSIRFPHPSVDGRCLAGLCKCQIIERGVGAALRVVIGDGRSDWCWAKHAEWRFAKSQLLTYCRAQGIACSTFEDFDTIRLALTRWLEKTRRPRRTAVPLSAVTNVY